MFNLLTGGKNEIQSIISSRSLRMGGMIDWWMKWAERRKSGIDWFAFVWFLGGLWAACGQWLRPRKQTQRANQFKDFSSIQSHQINFQFIWLVIELEMLNGWRVVLVFLSLWGVMGGAPANAPQRERQAKTRRTTRNSIQQMISLRMEWKKPIKQSLFPQFLFKEMKEKRCGVGWLSGMAHQGNFIPAASPTHRKSIILNEDWLIAGWGGSWRLFIHQSASFTFRCLTHCRPKRIKNNILTVPRLSWFH